MRRHLTYGLPALGFVLIVLVGFISLAPNKGISAYGAAPTFEIEGLSSDDIKSSGEEFVLVNVFASWCVPCEAEHPFIEKLTKDIPAYGIAFIDKREDTDSFLKRLGNPYKSLGYDTDGIAGVSWAVRGVPTSFLVDRNYNIIYRHDGPITPDIVSEIMEIKNGVPDE